MQKKPKSAGAKSRPARAASSKSPTPAASKASARKQAKAQPPAGKRAQPEKAPAPVAASGPSTPKKTRRAAEVSPPERSRQSKGSRPPTPTPPILLEGDETSRSTPVGGPGERFALGPAAERPVPPLATGELPSSYGTRRLLLVARDPHWLYAHWDLTDNQLREYNRQAAGGHLVVRIYLESLEGTPVVEQAVHPESRNWFLHVPRAGAKYIAELGYYTPAKRWTRVSSSAATLTPSDQLSEETWIRFETIPMDIPMESLAQLVRRAAADHVPLIEAIAQLRAQGFAQLPLPEAVATHTWSKEQEEALSRIISMDEVRRVWIGSLEITELIRRQFAHGISSGEVPISSLGAISSITSISSPFGAAARARGFWFNVNCELIVYGATDPRATVRIGDRTIRLRDDGTFSYRFSLPDGAYDLPIRATSPDGIETRSADLQFHRSTAYAGDVGRHPQDETLRPPRPENVA